MSRFMILAVLAGTLAIIVGGLVLTGGNTSGPPPATVPSAEPSASPHPSSRLGSIPRGVVGGWVAPSRGTSIENLTSGTSPALGGSGDVTTIAFMESADFTVGPAMWLDRRGTPLLPSAVAEESPGVLRFTMRTHADPECTGGDVGTYRWSQSGDGRWLTLELIDDACDLRAQILPGSWQRSLAHDSGGGPGIAAGFTPYLTFTLPEARYVGWGLPVDAVVVDRADGRTSFKVWKDPDGFVDPCDLSAGRLDLDPGMDAFLAYVREDPRFTVTDEQEFQIDGHRAVQVDFQLGENLSEPCWDFDGDPSNKTGVLLWNPGADPNRNAFWNGELDTPGTVVVTEVDGVTLAFEAVVVDDDGGFATDRATLDTVRFLDTLPSPPPG